MTRLPIKLRLTLAFVIAVAIVIAGAGLFVYARLQSDLDDAIDDGLARRAASVAPPAGRSISDLRAVAGAPADSQDGFAEVLDRSGHVIDAAGGYRGPVLSDAEAARAARRSLTLERVVPGIDSTTRILARPAATDGGPAVVVVGQSLEDRNETLAGLVRSFAIGGPIAILLAALLGYGLASAGLAPIEAMRRRAGEISLRPEDELLPLPAARDEVHRLGETLNQLLGRLRAAFERERGFVSDASHELRTPIAVIKAELEGALRSDDLGPEARAAVLAAVEECDSLAALAEDLLVIARAADGRVPVHPEPIDTVVLLSGMRERFADRAVGRGREIRIDVDPEHAPQLWADQARIRQALGNLIDNALRHGEGEVVLLAKDEGGEIVLAVADAGPGFSPAIADRAFERFSRGDEARTRGGTGLGLAIVRAIGEAHGGTVELGEPSPGGAERRTAQPRCGAEVRIRLPGRPRRLVPTALATSGPPVST